MTAITVQIASPYVTFEQYEQMSGIKKGMIQKMVAAGRLPIRPKECKKEKPLINMLALFNEAADMSERYYYPPCK
ncbi:hypothetical protein [Shewanella marina]|uniref:hypothetical protein n=1 Tax=Shewanella marina TaxID=487319 RepID=UPI000470E0AE|nr:hypothetical protein [Shewanella marina]